MFEMVIGLEVHIQLNTKSKMFCSCPVDFGAKANVNTCPVCLALPGSLPVLNKEAVKKAVSFAKAIDAELNIDSYFDRKHYFYPDSPKGYQISQFYLPIVGKGYINIDLGNNTIKRINITRAHLEEDAGKNIHEGEISKVDLNRAGTPLLEIVSEPDLRSAEEAVAYLKKLHSIVRYLDISDANMQEGSFRCDVNLSIREKGDDRLYTRSELKNINSFKFIAKAIEYEFNRHVEAWEDGVYNEAIVQETRLYDSNKNETRSMRSKEEALDYMYFNEPDLLRVHIDEDMLAEGSKIPELPDEKIHRYIRDFNIKKDDAVVLTSEVELSKFFDYMISKGVTSKNAVTWLNVELLGRLKNGLTVATSPVSADILATLVNKIEDDSISGKSAKDILDYLFENNTNKSIDEIIEEKGLKQVSDSVTIGKMIDEVMNANQDKVEQYKSGKDKLFGFFVGQVLKNNKGVNPQIVNKILKEKLA